MNRSENHDVFLSYRRESGSALAQLVYRYLRRRGYRVFMDVRDLRSGTFDVQLKQTIQEATDFVILVTPNCFDRCGDPNDWLRIEIETAFESGCNVVPLRAENAEWLPIEQWPQPINTLANHQTVTLNAEYCDAGLQRLTQLLKAPRRQRRTALAVILVVMLLGVVSTVLLLFRPDVRDDAVGLYWHGFGQRIRENQWREFDLHDGMTLYSDDQFRLVFSTNCDCIVYVIMANVDGVLGVQQRYECQKDSRYQVPGGIDWFTLDDETGDETVFLLASPSPIAELEIICDPQTPRNDRDAAASVRETADWFGRQSRGVSVESDHRIATNTYSSGKTVTPEMHLVASKAVAVQVIRFKHASYIAGD